MPSEMELPKELQVEDNAEFKKNFLDDRLITSVPAPYHKRITIEQLFPDGKTPDTDLLFKAFHFQAKLELDAASRVVSMAKEIMNQESNLLTIGFPITIVGDIHGQFYDLRTIFDQGIKLPEQNFLFLGDYVDRGWFSCECLLYLYALKIRFPQKVFLLRGNHESQRMTEYFTFKSECIHKYNEAIYVEIVKSFHALPLAAVVDGRFFCVHGGISPSLNLLSDIQAIDRKREPDTVGLMCDLLWSDPVDEANFASTLDDFMPNSVRKCSYHYSASACSKFIETNELVCIIRAHEVQSTGFKRFFGTSRHFPLVFTVFSAPNYLDTYKNQGGIIVIPHSEQFELKSFSSNPHPYYLPTLQDVFQWSTPFVLDKINQILTHILTIYSSEDEEMPEVSAVINTDKRESIKKKILALGKISSVYQSIQKDRISMLKLKGLTSPALSENPDALKLAADKCTETIEFDQVKEIDMVNESFPDSTPS